MLKPEAVNKIIEIDSLDSEFKELLIASIQSNYFVDLVSKYEQKELFSSRFLGISNQAILAAIISRSDLMKIFGALNKANKNK